ncbi:TMV resistance protein N-like [Cajanus cajan]|uniref:TMV resistance protein N-like n=1 Tax=Cajanus cajan TaxID=3821 RepID=UPI00098D82DA|nr:TMV resistance protein N-like [Cajanus cajan]
MAYSSSNDSQNKEHEVFVSFRGEDTRNTFTGHLNAALKRCGIRTYIDHDLRRGDEISQTLLRAIEEANLSVIVFSENFATSKWCLDEVVKILECKERNGQIVVPVFYHVDPSMVRNQTGSYGDAFAKHEQRFGGNTEKVQKWRKALTHVANHSGWECSPNSMESELVEEIGMDVLEKLNRVYVGDLDRQICKYEQLVELQTEYSDHIGRYATQDHIKKLKLERGIRLLRL